MRLDPTQTILFPLDAVDEANAPAGHAADQVPRCVLGRARQARVRIAVESFP
jgi:hypothetical protein